MHRMKGEESLAYVAIVTVRCNGINFLPVFSVQLNGLTDFLKNGSALS